MDFYQVTSSRIQIILQSIQNITVTNQSPL